MTHSKALTLKKKKNRKMHKKHGFFSRSKSADGRNTILRRRRKGRKKIAV